MRIAVFALALSAFAALAFSLPSFLQGGAAPLRTKQDAASEARVDFDFTRMNDTMRMAQLYRLTANPREFEGRTLRIAGVMLTRIDPDDGKRRFGCLIDDASGCSCCSPGSVIEFDSPPGLEWPRDFPPIESRVAVEGRLRMVEVSGGPPGRPVFAVPRLEATSLVQL